MSHTYDLMLPAGVPLTIPALDGLRSFLAAPRAGTDLTRQFVVAYRSVVTLAAAHIGAGSVDPALSVALPYTNHLLVATFLARSGSINDLGEVWTNYLRDREGDDTLNFYRDRLVGSLPRPWLDDAGLRIAEGVACIPDEVCALFMAEVYTRFTFVSDEAAQQDERAITPRIFGSVYEQITDERQEAGSYYTPPPVVSFLCRAALIGYLQAQVPDESAAGIGLLVDQRDPTDLSNPGAVQAALRRVVVCDPACGCGAILVGMLHEVAALRVVLERACGDAAMPRGALLAEIVTHSLLGIDRDPRAVGMTRIRLWLACVAASDDPLRVLLPDLRGRLSVDDSLLPDAEVGLASRICDIVVMNPPYLAAARQPGERRDAFGSYRRALKARYGFAGDLYIHFIYRAFDLLRDDGILLALTPTTYWTNMTKEHLRRLLLSYRLRALVQLGAGVFDAVVYAGIVSVQKAAAQADDRVYVVDLERRSTGAAGAPREAGGASIPVADYARAFGAIFYSPTTDNRLLFTSLLASEEMVMLGERRFVALGSIAPALDTGIHSGNVREQLFYRDEPAGRTLPKLLQGTQVVRYGVWWAHPDARYRFVDIDFLPDPALPGVGRGGRPSGRAQYWHFCGSIEHHHVTERLLLRQTADMPFAGYIRQDGARIYTDNTIHTLLLTSLGQRLGISYLYLLAVLNSAPLRRIYRALAQEGSRVMAQVKVALVNRLPIVVPSVAERTELEAHVDAIQAWYMRDGLPLSDAGRAEVNLLQAQIDALLETMYWGHRPTPHAHGLPVRISDPEGSVPR